MRGSGERRADARQRGAAVLLALFVATLATLIVSASSTVSSCCCRTIENQQLMTAEPSAAARRARLGPRDPARRCQPLELRRAVRALGPAARGNPPRPARRDLVARVAGVDRRLDGRRAGALQPAQSGRKRPDRRQGTGGLSAPVCRCCRLPTQTADLIAERMQEALPARRRRPTRPAHGRHAIGARQSACRSAADAAARPDRGSRHLRRKQPSDWRLISSCSTNARRSMRTRRGPK